MADRGADHHAVHGGELTVAPPETPTGLMSGSAQGSCGWLRSAVWVVELATAFRPCFVRRDSNTTTLAPCPDVHRRRLLNRRRLLKGFGHKCAPRAPGGFPFARSV